MQLKYNGQEQIQAAPSDVWKVLASPADIIACLPDVVSSKIVDDQHFRVVVNVSVGAVGGALDFEVELQPKPALNTMVVKLVGSGLGSSVDLMATAAIIDKADGSTTLDWAGVATIFGLLSNVGGRVLDAQGERIFQSVFSNLRKRVNAAPKA